MMSASIDTTDLSTVSFVEPFANYGGSASIVGNRYQKASRGGFATLTEALSLFWGHPNISTDTTPVKIPMQDRFYIGTTITGNWQEKPEQDLTEWFRLTKEEFGSVQSDNRAVNYRLASQSQDDAMPCLANSLKNLAELPKRVRASAIFENDISDAALESATRFLKLLGAIVGNTGLGWHDPHLSTEDHGDVEFAWWHEDKTLLISVTAEDVHYLRAWGSDIDNEMDEGINPTSEKLIEIWRWLYG